MGIKTSALLHRNIRLGSSTGEDPPLKRGMWVRLPPEAPSLGASSKELWQGNLARRWWRRGMEREMRVRAPPRPPTTFRRGGWNWETRRIQNPLPKGVEVRLLSPAPFDSHLW